MWHDAKCLSAVCTVDQLPRCKWLPAFREKLFHNRG